MKPACPAFLLAFLALALPARTADSGKVTGSFSLDGKTHTPKYVYAVPRPSILGSTKEDIVHAALQPQTPYRKFRSICAPSGVWTTSGWNWTP